MSSVYVQSSLWVDRSGCTHSFYQAFLFLELCDVTENGGAARTERSPMYRSIFFNSRHFFFQVHVDKHLSRQYSLKCCREHAKAAGVDIIPTNQSVKNKQERGPHDVQTQRWRFTFRVARLNFLVWENLHLHRSFSKTAQRLSVS